MFWHIKWITSGTDDTPAQVLLPIPPSPSSTTGEGTSLCSAPLCWPRNPVYKKINSVNTCIYITYACFVLVFTLSVHVHTVYIGLYNLKPHWLCTYIACTLETHVHTLYVHGVYMFYDLHTVSKHHIYNASCQESSILYIDCLDLTHTCWNWLYAIISNLVSQCQALSRWSGFYGFSVFRVNTCIYNVLTRI